MIFIHSGKWYSNRITLGCAVIGTAAAVIGVMPTATGYVGTALSPWTTMPDQIHHLDQKVDKIMDALNVPPIAGVIRTNAVLVTGGGKP